MKIMIVQKKVMKRRSKVPYLSAISDHYSPIRALLCIGVLFLISCATNPQLKAPTMSQLELIRKTRLIESQSQPLEMGSIRKKLEQFKKALKRGKLRSTDLKLHDELLKAYIQLKRQNQIKLTMAAKGRLVVPLETYCLDGGKASPAAAEYYFWQKSRDPKIKYYQQVLEYRRRNKISQNETQTLLWNLGNKTFWENYPNRLQTVLKNIDPQAPVKLPSKLRSQVIDTITDQFLNMPGISETRDTVQMIQGKFYEFDAVRRSVESMTSKEPLTSMTELPQLPGSEVFASSVSNGFSSQKVTFFNPTDEPQEIDLRDYYLAPLRIDVQRIGINPKISKYQTLFTELEKALFEDMARLGLGFTPGLNDVADVYELLTGLDFVNSKRLSAMDRMLSGIGIIVGSGQSYRYVKRAIHSPPKYVDDFAEGLAKAAKRPANLTEKSLSGARAGVQNANRIVESARNVRPKLGNKYVKKLPDLAGSLKEAFDGHIFKGTYEPGEILFQAQRTGQTSPGNWFGPIRPMNSDHADALFNIHKWGNDAGQIKAYVVKERISGYAGKVAGGEGHQFYLPKNINIDDVVEEVK